MSERPPLSRGEMEVARVLWEIGPAGVRQVHEKLSEHRDIDFATVQTYLRRLEQKGYASSRRDGRARIYAARGKPRTVIRDTVNEFVERLFGGDAMPLVRHLIKDRGLEAADLDEIRELIDRMDSGGDST